MSEKTKDPNKTPILQYPLLTEDEKAALLIEPNHGIHQAKEIKRFKDYDEWMSRGGASANFWMRFSNILGGAHREPQWIQRFAILYTELDANLINAVAGFGPGTPFDSATEHNFYDAYNKLADLVDEGDVGVNNDLPVGQVDPYILLS